MPSSDLGKLDTTYKWVKMRERRNPGKRTRLWIVFNAICFEEIGVIRWYQPWRKYCFITRDEEIVISLECMVSIADFIKLVTAERKEKKDA